MLATLFSWDEVALRIEREWAIDTESTSTLQAKFEVKLLIVPANSTVARSLVHEMHRCDIWDA